MEVKSYTLNHPGAWMYLCEFHRFYKGVKLARVLVCFPIYLYEPVSVKIGLNDMKMKITITASLESIIFSKHLLEI